MNEPSGWWTVHRLERCAAGLAQDVRPRMHVRVEWPGSSVLQMEELS